MPANNALGTNLLQAGMVGQCDAWTIKLVVLDLGDRDVDARAQTGAGDWWLDERHEGQRTEAPNQQ
jgi:hypothetical protein